MHVRPAAADDRAAVLALAQRALGWEGNERDRRFFAWKHDDNPFGPSPSWVAESDEGEVVAFRTFLRWEFVWRGTVVRAVRAVDTATHPSFEGRGLFRELTTTAVEALRADGVGFVFNTPNEKSRPGYLKMGWAVMGRPPVLFRPLSPRLPSRAPAAKWSLDVDGTPAVEALEGVELPPSSTLATTHRTPEYLRWRFAFEDLHYRAATVDGGVAVYRVRERGRAREVAVCEILARDAKAEAELIRRIARARPGDYLLRVGRARREREVPLPRQGPVLTARALATEPPPLAEWDLALADVELF